MWNIQFQRNPSVIITPHLSPSSGPWNYIAVSKTLWSASEEDIPLQEVAILIVPYIKVTAYLTSAATSSISIITKTNYHNFNAYHQKHQNTDPFRYLEQETYIQAPGTIKAKAYDERTLP